MRNPTTQTQAEATYPTTAPVALIDITCRGVTPLLMNRIKADTLEGLRNPGGKRRSKTAPRPEDPREEASVLLYLDEEGFPYIPIEMLFACLVAAGQSVRLDGKRQVSTTKSTLLPSFLSIDSTSMRLYQPGTKKAATWEVDMRPGRNPHGGELVCLVRPRFNQWEFHVSVSVDTQEVGIPLVRQIVDFAGKRAGLGDFRPNRKGPFGRFEVIRWQEKKTPGEAAA